MSEHSQKTPTTPDETVQKENSAEVSCVYHWNYAAQAAYDREAERRERKKGILRYTLCVLSVFALCLALLFWVASRYQPTQNPAQGTPSNGVNTIGNVASEVNPATVLILASNGYSTSFGTGFFIRSDGYIATNDHVVANQTDIKVHLYTGEVLDAQYVAGSAVDDLAVLKVKSGRYPTVRIGDSSRVCLGDTVVAIGNPSGEEAAWTVTHGIISSTSRLVAVSGTGYTAEVKMMQTDAPLNPGNSGGPLCNTRGEVIGIVSRKLTGYEGIGFAIPINEAMQSLQKMIDSSYVQSESAVSKTRPSIGVSVADLPAGTVLSFENGEEYITPYNGVCVQKVVEGSGADGVLKSGDLIYAMDGKAVSDIASLQSLLYHYNVGDSAVFKIFRRGQEIEVTVRLGIVES